MLDIRALLVCYWLLVACCDAAALSVARRDVDNSTVQQPGGDLPQPESNVENSTLNYTASPNQPVNESLQEYFRQTRIANIRDQILAKLGMTEPPSYTEPVNISSLLDEQSLSTLLRYLNGTLDPASGSSRGGGEDDCSHIKGDTSSFYAKELRVHFPGSFRGVVPSVELFEWGT